MGDYHPSKSCPAFGLYKKNWQDSGVSKKRETEDNKQEEKFCLRCNRENLQESTECGYCNFDKFSAEPIQPACHAFAVYPPEVILK